MKWPKVCTFISFSWKILERPYLVDIFWHSNMTGYWSVLIWWTITSQPNISPLFSLFQLWQSLESSFIVHYFNSVFTDGRRHKHGKNPGRPIVFELFPKLCHVTEETIEDDYKERVDRRLKPMEVPQNHFKKKNPIWYKGRKEEKNTQRGVFII